MTSKHNKGSLVSISLFIVLMLALVVIPMSGLILGQMAKQQYDDRLGEQRLLGKRLAGLTSETLRSTDLAPAASNRTVLAPSQRLGLAGAKLHDRLAKIISAGHGNLESIQVLQAKRDGDAVRVSAKVALTATTVAMRRIVLAIEKSVPFILIDKIAIRNISGRTNAGSVDKRRQQWKRLAIAIEASNYMQHREF